MALMDHSIANREIQDSIINSNFTEEKWLSNMKSLLHRKLLHQTHHKPIFIFQIPNSVISTKPEAYTPQIIALGPYHNFNPNLYKSQRFKLHQSQIFHQDFNLPGFEILSDEIQKKLMDLPSSYTQHLDISTETLSWIMVIDGLFLLRLIYNQSETMLFDESGRKFSVDSILKDCLMVENQIPFLILEHLVSRYDSDSTSKNAPLLPMAIELCRKISPIAIKGMFFPDVSESPLHLLDILYKLVWFGGIEIHRIQISPEMNTVVYSQLWSLTSALNVGFLSIPQKIIEVIIKIFQALGISIPFPSLEEEQRLIPSAYHLSKCEVKFLGCDSVKFISFSQEDATLRLPVLTLNAQSGAVIRNLMVYEAMVKPESPDFAWYIEMMASMIQSVEDVQVLKSKGIVIHDGDCGEIVKLLKEIGEDCKSNNNIGPKGKSELFEEVTKKVNEHYDGNRRTKLKRLFKKSVYSVWKIFTVFATLLVLMLLALQTYCSAYGCRNLFNTEK